MKKILIIIVGIFLLLSVTSTSAIGPSTRLYYSFYEPDVTEFSRALGDDVNLKQKTNIGMQLEIGLPKGVSIVGSISAYFGEASSVIEKDMGLLGTMEFPLNHQLFILPFDLMLKYKFIKFPKGALYGLAGWSWSYSIYRMEIGGTYATLMTSGLNSTLARGWDNSGFVIGAGAEVKIAIVSAFVEVVSRNGKIDSYRYFDTGFTDFDGKLITDDDGNKVGVDLSGIEYRVGISIGF